MFKQVKSALIWYYLFRFRRRVFLIILLLLFAFFTQSIYGDVVNYLTLTHQLHLLKYALFGKWLIIFASLLASIYSLINLFKNINNKNSSTMVPTISSKEQRFREKPQLCSRADQLITRKAKEKAEREQK